MRAPPESLMPITGQPILAARSMIFTIFSAITSPREPPKTVKSWLNTQTGRPSILPWPVTTASPQGRFFSMSKSAVRWRTKVSSSSKVPSSSSLPIRSRAVSLPFSCCFSTAFSEAEWIAASRSSWSWASFSSYVSGDFCLMAVANSIVRRVRARAALVLIGLLALAAPTSAAAVGPKIVGGTAAAPGEYPAQAFVESRIGACGGSLVTSQKVLTAAHCVFGEESVPSDFQICLGQLDRGNCGGSSWYGVSSIDRNSSYNPVTAQNDAALLTLDRPAPL